MRLHDQVKHQAAIIDQLKANIEVIQSYVSSSKFSGPEFGSNMVNRDDILLRINEGHQEITLLEI